MLRPFAFDRRRVALIFGWMGSLGLVAVACVSTDPPPNPPLDVDAAIDGGGEVDASVPDGGEPDGGDVAECGDGRAICGSSCVDLSTSKDHCGLCDHGCGGGDCAGGVCQPTLLVGDLPATAAFDVSEDTLFYANQRSVLSCPAEGCAGASKSLCTLSNSVAALMVVKDTVIVQTSEKKVFTCQSSVAREPLELWPNMKDSGDGMTKNTAGGAFLATKSVNGDNKPGIHVMECSEGKCSPKQIYEGDFLSDLLAASETETFFRKRSESFAPSLDYLACPLGKECRSPTSMGNINGDDKSTVAMRALGVNRLAIAVNAVASGANEPRGQLHVCVGDASGSLACPAVGDPLPFRLGDFDADDTRLYFAGNDSIWTCPREGCKGGAPSVSVKVSAFVPGTLRTTSKYLYWLSGKGERAIWRVAKPVLKTP